MHDTAAIHRRTAQDDGGFTLIEILIAIVLVGILVCGRRRRHQQPGQQGIEVRMRRVGRRSKGGIHMSTPSYNTISRQLSPADNGERGAASCAVRLRSTAPALTLPRCRPALAATPQAAALDADHDCRNSRRHPRRSAAVPESSRETRRRRRRDAGRGHAHHRHHRPHCHGTRSRHSGLSAKPATPARATASAPTPCCAAMPKPSRLAAQSVHRCCGATYTVTTVAPPAGFTQSVSADRERLPGGGDAELSDAQGPRTVGDVGTMQIKVGTPLSGELDGREATTGRRSHPRRRIRADGRIDQWWPGIARH